MQEEPKAVHNTKFKNQTKPNIKILESGMNDKFLTKSLSIPFVHSSQDLYC